MNLVYLYFDWCEMIKFFIVARNILFHVIKIAWNGCFKIYLRGETHIRLGNIASVVTTFIQIVQSLNLFYSIHAVLLI